MVVGNSEAIADRADEQNENTKKMNEITDKMHIISMTIIRTR